MEKRTFAEKIFGAKAGDIVFARPDLILSHDNTASIEKTFEKMGGNEPIDPEKLLVVLDHNAPPTNAKVATLYVQIRNFAEKLGLKKFYDSGNGICHQLMSNHAKPGLLIVGSDSHTCTAGAFNAFAAGIDRTEAAGLWKKGETWFRVPNSLKITLTGKLPAGVYAKDLSLWIIGMIGSAGANYMSIEYHGEGVKTLSISERMTIANLASEMGAKNAVFPCDETLKNHLGTESQNAVWADEGANYEKEITIDLNKLFPVVAAPHHVDNIKALNEVEGIPVQQGIIGTCTNGRIEDLRIAAGILDGKKVAKNFQLLIIPASKETYQQAMQEGIIDVFLEANAQILSPSCGPCLGTGQGIPADGVNIISTANRNFKGRMGNKNASIYLASPASVAISALNGKITSPSPTPKATLPFTRQQGKTKEIEKGENRRFDGIWDYSDIDNLNTDHMFAGDLTYEITSSNGEEILPHLFERFDGNFNKNVREDDIIIAGENFGCGSSREHPAVGLAFAGIRAIITKSANRIFYRSCINQGLLLLVLPQLVSNYRQGNPLKLEVDNGIILMNGAEYTIPALPAKLMEIIESKGLVKWMQNQLG